MNVNRLPVFPYKNEQIVYDIPRFSRVRPIVKLQIQLTPVHTADKLQQKKADRPFSNCSRFRSLCNVSSINSFWFSVIVVFPLAIYYQCENNTILVVNYYSNVVRCCRVVCYSSCYRYIYVAGILYFVGHCNRPGKTASCFWGSVLDDNRRFYSNQKKVVISTGSVFNGHDKSK